MKEMILRAVDLKKNGESFPMMGVKDGDKEWELIATVTASEDTSSIKASLDGQFTAIAVKATILANDNNGEFRMQGSCDGTTIFNYVRIPSGVTTAVKYTYAYMMRDNGVWFCGGGTTTTNSYYIQEYQSVYNGILRSKEPYIDSISVFTTASKIPKDSTVDIYGIRA